jgi:hypothetical protein
MSFKIIKQKKPQVEISNKMERDERLVRILLLDHNSFYQQLKDIAIDNISIEQYTEPPQEKQTDSDEKFFEDIFQKDEVKVFKKIIAEELDSIITDDNQKNNSKHNLIEQPQPQVIDRRKRR